MCRNAIIMAAGTSSRFVPLSNECPKGLLEVKGEILIERQIRQLKDAGVEDITVVTGYKAEMFEYLKEKYGVSTVMNEDYYRYNNTSSIIRVLDRLHDTYICSSDNYFNNNVFVGEPHQSYYSALHAGGETREYCMTIDGNDNITAVTVGGRNSWYMIGHVYLNADFSHNFRQILNREYDKEEVRQGYWEDVYIRHIKELPFMKMRRYNIHDIEEFDSIDELRLFDETYVNDTRSSVIRFIASQFGCNEGELSGFTGIRHNDRHLLFTFQKDGDKYMYNGKDNTITRL